MRYRILTDVPCAWCRTPRITSESFSSANPSFDPSKLLGIHARRGRRTRGRRGTYAFPLGTLTILNLPFLRRMGSNYPSFSPDIVAFSKKAQIGRAHV